MPEDHRQAGVLLYKTAASEFEGAWEFGDRVYGGADQGFFIPGVNADFAASGLGGFRDFLSHGLPQLYATHGGMKAPDFLTGLGMGGPHFVKALRYRSFVRAILHHGWGAFVAFAGMGCALHNLVNDPIFSMSHPCVTRDIVGAVCRTAPRGCGSSARRVWDYFLPAFRSMPPVRDAALRGGWCELAELAVADSGGFAGMDWGGSMPRALGLIAARDPGSCVALGAGLADAILCAYSESPSDDRVEAALEASRGGYSEAAAALALSAAAVSGSLRGAVAFASLAAEDEGDKPGTSAERGLVIRLARRVAGLEKTLVSALLSSYIPGFFAGD